MSTLTLGMDDIELSLRKHVQELSVGSGLGSEFLDDSVNFLITEVKRLTDHVVSVSPSEWAEENRYLPQSVTPQPGFYSYEVSPPLREIVDCLDVRSPVREITFMKAAQVGATVGILENGIGYVMEVVKSAPTMMVTADDGLAQLRMELYVTPMMQQSGLMELIQSGDETNTRKSGKTDKKIEWRGGGFLIPTGAVNPNKGRSISIRYLLKDEPDGWPLTTPQGDPDAIFDTRTDAYEQTRKILNISTPLIESTSRIDRKFKEGDQRFFFVPCKKCNTKQKLEFWREDPETKYRWGIVYEVTDDGLIVEGTTRYKCCNPECGHLHVNDDKAWMLNRGEWRATAKPKASYVRSYHLNALYAPAFAKSWESCAIQYLTAWDVQRNRPKDNSLFQVFRNNVLGKTYVERGEGVRFEQVSAHRRLEYKYKEIPNTCAAKWTGQPVALLTCAVDVQDKYLSVAVMGWTEGFRCFLIEYFELVGDATTEGDPPTWGELATFIENTTYTADDGRQYLIDSTVVDAGDGGNQDVILKFCAGYEGGVTPIIGRAPTKTQAFKEFREWKTQLGSVGYAVNVDHYKDRWNNALKKSWDGVKLQPVHFFNVPFNCTDKQLQELTKERKREKIDKKTGKREGFEWYRSGGGSSKNELWDLLIYNNAAMELIAWEICIRDWEMDAVDWSNFWTHWNANRVYTGS